MKSKNIIFICLIFMLVACSSNEKQVTYFNQHPVEAQKAAQECIAKARQNENIEKDNTCMAVISYKSQYCRIKQQEHALLYSGYDCENKAHMLWMAARGD